MTLREIMSRESEKGEGVHIMRGSKGGGFLCLLWSSTRQRIRAVVLLFLLGDDTAATWTIYDRTMISDSKNTATYA